MNFHIFLPKEKVNTKKYFKKSLTFLKNYFIISSTLKEKGNFIMSFDFYNNFMVIDGKPNFHICARCGAAIKYPFEFQGKIYGSECITKVSGRSIDQWVVVNGVIDEEATAKRIAEAKEKENKFNEMAAKRFADAQVKAAQCIINNKWLVDVLCTVPGQFCQDMASQLNSSELKDFSNRQLNIMVDIYGKYHGRRNSKQYNNACDRFWSKFDQENQREEQNDSK